MSKNVIKYIYTKYITYVINYDTLYLLGGEILHFKVWPFYMVAGLPGTVNEDDTLGTTLKPSGGFPPTPRYPRLL